MQIEELLTLKQTAAALGVSYSVLYGRLWRRAAVGHHTVMPSVDGPVWIGGPFGTPYFTPAQVEKLRPLFATEKKSEFALS